MRRSVRLRPQRGQRRSGCPLSGRSASGIDPMHTLGVLLGTEKGGGRIVALRLRHRDGCITAWPACPR